MGNPNTKDTGQALRRAGPAGQPRSAHRAPGGAARSAEFGMIGLLNAGAGGDPNAPTAPWGRDDSLGNDRAQRPRQHVGRRNRRLVRRRRSRPLRHRRRRRRSRRRHRPRQHRHARSRRRHRHRSGLRLRPRPPRRLAPDHEPPQVRMGATQVNGRLPPEVIQRIVRQNFGRFRLCYENGLRNNPNLQGRVSVRFVIGRDGAVSNVRQRRLGHAGSAASCQCVVRGVLRPVVPAARRRHRHGRLPDHVRAGRLIAPLHAYANPPVASGDAGGFVFSVPAGRGTRARLPMVSRRSRIAELRGAETSWSS